jgi:hypothetical protein
VSWYQLLDIRKQAAGWAEFYAARPPTNCPNDGEPLDAVPPGRDGELFCKFDGWTYPRDWDPATMAGM